MTYEEIPQLRLFILLIFIFFANANANVLDGNNGAQLVEKGNMQAMQGNYSAAETLYKQATELKEPSAYYSLGMLALNGYGQEKDLNKAVALYTKAAELDYSQAQYELSVLYSVADYGLVDNEKYLNWLTKAANNGHKLACHNLASIAVRVGKTATGIAYYKKAAAQGHLPSIMSLGMIHYSGIGTQKNYGLALKYFSLAAEQDDLEAVRLLAMLSERGLGTVRDTRKAKALYNKAYQAGNLNAGYNLALLYLDEKRPEEAESLLQKLSTQGLDNAMLLLKQLKAKKGIKLNIDDAK